MKDKASSLSTGQLQGRVEALQAIERIFPAQHDAARGAREYLHAYYLELAKRANPNRVFLAMDSGHAWQTSQWSSSDPIVRTGPSPMPDLPRNHGSPWTPAMDKELTKHWCLGKWSMAKIASAMGRSDRAIQCRLVHLGIISECT